MVNLGIDLGTATVIVSYCSKNTNELKLVYPESNLALIPNCVYKNGNVEIIGMSAKFIASNQKASELLVIINDCLILLFTNRQANGTIIARQINRRFCGHNSPLCIFLDIL